MVAAVNGCGPCQLPIVVVWIHIYATIFMPSRQGDVEHIVSGLSVWLSVCLSDHHTFCVSWLQQVTQTLLGTLLVIYLCVDDFLFYSSIQCIGMLL